MNRDNLMVTCIEESNLINNIVANRWATESFACLNIPDDNRVIILSSYRGKVLFIKWKCKALNQNFM